MQLRASRKEFLIAEVLVHAAPLYLEPVSNTNGFRYRFTLLALKEFLSV